MCFIISRYIYNMGGMVTERVRINPTNTSSEPPKEFQRSNKWHK